MRAAPGERERATADDRDELAMHVALGVAKPPREAANAFAVDHAVGDQPHRASDEIRAQIPLGRARSRVRAAALACAKAGRLRGGSRHEQANVLASGRARGTARATVDVGRRGASNVVA